MQDKSIHSNHNERQRICLSAVNTTETCVPQRNNNNNGRESPVPKGCRDSDTSLPILTILRKNGSATETTGEEDK